MCSPNKGKDDFETGATELRALVRLLSIKHLTISRADFYFENEQYIRGLQRKVNSHVLSYQEALQRINKKINELRAKDEQIAFNKIKHYVIIQKEKKNKLTKLILKNVGFVAGGAAI